MIHLSQFGRKLRRYIRRFGISISSLATVLIVSSCTSTQPILLILLLDRSKSALESPDYLKFEQQICHQMANSVRLGDRILIMGVDGESPLFTDATIVRDTDQLHKQCKEILEVNTEKPYTVTCPYWDQVLSTLNRPQYKNLPVFVGSVIETNEGEVNFCPETVTKVASIVHKRAGRLVVAGSTNNGNHNYNELLSQTLKDAPGVTFPPNSDSAIAEFNTFRRSGGQK